ncbi:DUF2780 domain-containing protein, partial [Pseudomonas aeruginosa]|uniref:DUF2780 domain-containing protein n=1 Tax=Pseudomonas aeruginosa TaxID=287 RepID=UPI0039DF3753|nr:DUF2780 domain-containing protein [Pseudomonas aeruginosa]
AGECAEQTAGLRGGGYLGGVALGCPGDRLGGIPEIEGERGGGDSKGLGSLLGNADSMGDVNKAFGTLGMDSGMTEKFAQVLV